MAHTKSGGSTRNHGDAVSKRLGVKLHDGEVAGAGEIILRQRGTCYLPGRNVARAGDDTLYAKKEGVVHFKIKRKMKFDRSVRIASIVSIG